MDKDFTTLKELHDIKDTRLEEYLIGCLDELKVQLVNCSEDETFRILQGKARAYSDLLKDIEQAYEDMLKSKKTQINMSKAF